MGILSCGFGTCIVLACASAIGFQSHRVRSGDFKFVLSGCMGVPETVIPFQSHRVRSGDFKKR